MRDVTAPRLVEHIAAHAHEYFDDLTRTSVRVRLVTTSERYRTRLYRVQVSDGSVEHQVLAKVVSGRRSLAVRDTAPSALLSRPRLLPRTEPSVNAECESRGLVGAFEHFTSLADPRLDAVRPYEYLPDLNAIIMAAIDEPTLDKVLLRAIGMRMLPSRGMDLGPVFRNAGTWLREFHGLHHLASVTLRESAEDVQAAFVEFADFVGIRDPELGGQIHALIQPRIPEIVPTPLPLGLSHGDYSPRNVFVGPTGKVRIFDMCALSLVPIFEDIAHFMVSLRTARPQFLTQGRMISSRTMAEYERELIRGYFDSDEISRSPLDLFQLLLLLDKWAYLAAAASDQPARKRRASQPYQFLLRRHFAQEAARLVQAIRAA